MQCIADQLPILPFLVKITIVRMDRFKVNSCNNYKETMVKLPSHNCPGTVQGIVTIKLDHGMTMVKCASNNDHDDP